MIYGREALRKHREERAHVEQQQEREADLLSKIPADAEMDDATLCVWNGERFVAWDTWVATRPVYADDTPAREKEAVPSKQAAPAADLRRRAVNDQQGLW